jgi:hypothetical protein
LHSLFEGPAVTYSNLILAAVISSPDHPAWQWLAKRNGHIDGLSLKLCVGQNGDQLSGWMQPLQTLSSIPSVQLRVEWVGSIDELDHPFISQWLRQYAQIISHLTIEVDVSEDRLKLRDFSEAAAPCSSLDLTVSTYFFNQVVDLADLAPVAASLQRLHCQSRTGQHDCFNGAQAFTSMSHLTALRLELVDFQTEELWSVLANLTSLQDLSFIGSATGDPSPLSALTRLSSLYLHSYQPEEDQAPFSFSSLQPLSTLQQLERLDLCGHAVLPRLSRAWLGSAI